MSDYSKHVQILRAMSHPVRLKILEILAQGPACVCELISRIGQRQAYISQHLMLLRQTGMVKNTRMGVNKRYELAEPDLIRRLLRCILQTQDPEIRNTEEIKMSGIQNSNSWHGIPRTQIQWFPTVAVEGCNGCGLCATSCGKNVYAFDYEANKPVVVAPESCTVGCTTCAALCTQDAIEFPSLGYVHQVIKKNKVLTQAKNMLRANPPRYDITKRTPVAG